MSDQIEPGSVVKLKSGSAKMTVENIYDADHGQRANCVWYADVARSSGSLPEVRTQNLSLACLELAK